LAVNRGQKVDMIGKNISHHKVLEKLGEGGMPVPLPKAGREVWSMIERTISHYRILEKLGEGGMPVPLKRSESLRSRCLKRGGRSGL
jgi:hypothetical protein